jgi:hypothetical protein
VDFSSLFCSWCWSLGSKPSVPGPIHAHIFWVHILSWYMPQWAAEGSFPAQTVLIFFVFFSSSFIDRYYFFNRWQMLSTLSTRRCTNAVEVKCSFLLRLFCLNHMIGWTANSSTALHQHWPIAWHSATTQGSAPVKFSILSSSECVLQEYLKDWHPRLIGLTGTPEQVISYHLILLFIFESFGPSIYMLDVFAPVLFLFQTFFT